MVNVITELSKYAMILFLGLHTLLGFRLVRKPEDEKRASLWQQNILFFGMHFLGNLVLYLNTDNEEILYFYGAQALLFLAFLILHHVIYPKEDKLLNHNLVMLLSVGFLMLARLSFDKAERQFEIAVLAMGLTFLIPLIIRKVSTLRRLHWFYGAVGLILLLVVLIAGTVSSGAKLTITILGVSFQPSEFVKILFVFFVAGMLQVDRSFRQVALTTALAAAYVLVLVASKDLGGALIFFVTYLVMLYVATKQPLWFLAGLLAGSGAAWVAWKLFAHVQTRVLAWSDPFSVIDNEGYQITQSLFAIGTGGWFGMGIGQGMPYKIPVVEEDFIFAAIAEELGILFAIILIFVYLCSFYMIINIAMCLKDSYYKLVALGLGTMLTFQVFLCVGGVVKFIPSTGVTLSFVSYGGSSLLSTFVMWAIIQGMYLKRSDEVAENDRRGKAEKIEKKGKKEE
ncbi:MAG: FtsW/RodA/SpoVE family cell cycle protein [Lachnospiraceae bacterium]|nr:FtsW/RodA/SpoVE family cell cycle protein [Lachnospiraceae bacterium]